ncbi:hypothetical protein [Oceanobacter mangrovi]|uniref:hypothetical protein n=1 Tax=Oceanobacter mangrovi TaxID=2862510 RepID=UPI001C8EADDE|nr:hypothetical protein [Oceanobacter mangrovi]
MPYRHYQLTYSISPKNAQCQAEAQKARRAIKESSQFTNVDHLETVVVGELYLARDSQYGQKREAQEDIENFITGILNDAEVFKYVHVHCSLMVDGLGEHLQFTVKDDS